MVFLSFALLVQAALAEVPLEVEVQGVSGEVKKNVLSFLDIERLRKSPELNEEMMKSLFGRAPKEIQTALQPFGFYTPRISSRLIKKNGRWMVIFVIDPGQPARISKLDLRISGAGSKLPPFVYFRKTFPLKQGGVLDQQAYETSKQALQEIAANYGFLNATMPRHQILVYPDRHEAQVFLQFDTGPQFLFGDVTFIQSKKIFSEGFLRKFINFKKGAPFNSTELVAFQDALSSSGYFSQAQVTPEPKKAEGLLVPIVVTLTPAKRYEISLGAGYGTDTGFRGRLDWMDRHVNSRGHRMEVDLRMAQIRQNAIWRYTVPLDQPMTNHLDYTLGFLHESTDIETSETYFAEFSYTRAISVHWLQTLYFEVAREYFTVADESATDKLIIPGGTWTYKKAPVGIYTHEGIQLIADARGTSRAIFSSVSFIQGRLRPKYIRGIGGIGSFILRADIGATAVSNFQRLPASYRFFAGGERSIRGYSYKTLGPKNAQGLVEGGKYLMVAGIEYVQKIYGKWGMAFFYDGGNAFSAFPPSWKSGAGTGIRWNSPVGPARLDFAWALEPGHPFHIYVSIGPEI